MSGRKACSVFTSLKLPLTDDGQMYMLLFRYLGLVLPYPRWALVFLEKLGNLGNFIENHDPFITLNLVSFNNLFHKCLKTNEELNPKTCNSNIALLCGCFCSCAIVSCAIVCLI